MKRLEYEDVEIKFKDSSKIKAYNSLYNNRKTFEKFFEITKGGYNLFLIDNFTLWNKKQLIDILEDLNISSCDFKDICYVVLGNSKSPYGLKVKSGYGKRLKDGIEKIKKDIKEIIEKFNNNTTDIKKKSIEEKHEEKKDKIIDNLIDISYDEGFEFKATDKGFTFVPLIDGEEMEEELFEKLEEVKKEEVYESLSKLKELSEEIIVDIAVIEEEKIKELNELLIFILSEYKDSNIDILTEQYKGDKKSCNYLIQSLNKILDDLSGEEQIVDTEIKSLNEIFDSYDVKVVVDNSSLVKPPIVFVDDPTSAELFGSYEIESIGGSYTTGVSMLNAGSLLKADGGTLIIRVNSILNYSTSYRHLKNFLYCGKVGFKGSSNLENVVLNGFEPKEIESSAKVILIGDYEYYEHLYNADQDFKNLFKLKIINEKTQSTDNMEQIISTINSIAEGEKLVIEDDGALKLIVKKLMRDSENRSEVQLDYDNIETILMLCSEDNSIKYKNVYDHIYLEDEIEIQTIKQYKDEIIKIDIEGSRIGQVNGLSVLTGGDFSFGKCFRITCVCSRGHGNIIDSHKESDLSGRIHCKSLIILKSLLMKYIGQYREITVDFHLSFEQLYGMLEGDSASVAEFIAMISQLSKIPIKQNIALTGSIDQFGQIQAIGGVNDKVEGFYKVCKLIGNIEGKAVLIPEDNVKNLILRDDIEAEIKRGGFTIYTMKTLEDALEIMLDMEEYSAEKLGAAILRELVKYN